MDSFGGWTVAISQGVSYAHFSRLLDSATCCVICFRFCSHVFLHNEFAMVMDHNVLLTCKF